MAQNDHSDIYIIPPNFVKEGTLFSGRAESRNVVEAAFPLFLSSCFHIL